MRNVRARTKEHGATDQRSWLRNGLVGSDGDEISADCINKDKGNEHLKGRLGVGNSYVHLGDGKLHTLGEQRTLHSFDDTINRCRIGDIKE